jgi:hypothetical protein
MNAKQTVSLFKAVMEGPFTRFDMALKINVSPKSVGRIIGELKSQKMIHIIDYTNESDGRNRVKVYALGDGEDAKPKSGQSQEERSRKSYLRKAKKKRDLNIKTTFVGGVSLWQ